MALEWLTYSVAAERLGISPEAVRQKAIRAKWSKRMGNDGRAEVRVDVDELRAATPPRSQTELPNELPSDARPMPERAPIDYLADGRTLDALDAHIETLKTMFAKAEHAAERERERTAEERARADVERARADALAVELTMLRAAGAEQTASFEQHLAELRALVDGLNRPWWKRLARGSEKLGLGESHGAR